MFKNSQCTFNIFQVMLNVWGGKFSMTGFCGYFDQVPD